MRYDILKLLRLCFVKIMGFVLAINWCLKVVRKGITVIEMVLDGLCELTNSVNYEHSVI